MRRSRNQRRAFFERPHYVTPKHRRFFFPHSSNRRSESTSIKNGNFSIFLYSGRINGCCCDLLFHYRNRFRDAGFQKFYVYRSKLNNLVDPFPRITRIRSAFKFKRQFPCRFAFAKAVYLFESHGFPTSKNRR